MAVKWTEEQKRVIETRGRNILVSAAAGSGKTAVLVARILSRICDREDPANIDELLIVTFTKAAAGEMRDRLLKALLKEREQHPDDPHLARQVTLLPGAMITTIDGFCSYVVKNYGHRIGITPGARIAEAGEIELIRQDALKEVLEEAYADPSPEFQKRMVDFVETFAAGKTEYQLEKSVLRIAATAESSPDAEGYLASCLRGLEVHSADGMMEEPWMKEFAADAAEEIRSGYGYVKRCLEIAESPSGPSRYIPSASADYELFRELKETAAKGHGMTASDYDLCRKLLQDFKAVPLSRKKAEAGEDAELAALFKELRGKANEIRESLLTDYFPTSAEEAADLVGKSAGPIATLLEITSGFLGRFREIKQRKRVMDFSDLEHYALRILVEDGERTYAARELSESFREVMIDEYQDSNYLQEAILTAVSRISDGEQNYFTVGDIKQSIYSFREARPELFAKKYERYRIDPASGAAIDLHRNFRSRGEVISTANVIFRQIMRREIGQVEYDEAAALIEGASYPEAEGFRSEMLVLTEDEAGSGSPAAGKLASSDAKEMEARMIGERIRELVGHGTLYDPSLGRMRRVQFRDIVILLRTMEGWADVFQKVLEAMRIPAFSTAKSGYFSASEVTGLLNYLSILDNPEQDIPFAGVLTSAFAGLNSEEMALIRTADIGVSLSGSKDRGDVSLYDAARAYAYSCGDGTDLMLKGRLEDFFALYDRLREALPDTPLHSLIDRILFESGYYDYVSALPGGAQRAMNLRMLVDKAVEYEETSYIGLFNFIRYIENLKKYSQDFGELNTLSEQDDVVRIYSVHKSKGLEFPIVFAAGLGKTFNMQDMNSDLLVHPELGIASGYLDYRRRTRAKTLSRQAIRRRMLKDSLGEELRVLYVALTRAKEKLIMTGTFPGGEAKLAELMQLLMKEEVQMPCAYISSARNALQLLLPAVQRTMEGGPLCLKGTGIDLKWVHPMDLMDEEVQASLRREDQILMLQGLERGRTYDPLMRRAIEERFLYVYPYAISQIPVEMSVSEIKAEAVRGAEGALASAGGEEGYGAEAEPYYKEEIISPLIPAFYEEDRGEAGKRRDGEGELAGAARGTAYHRVFELLPLHKLKGLEGEDLIGAIGQEICRMRDSGRLTEREAAAVRTGDVAALVMSPLGRRMAYADAQMRLCREQPFVLSLDASKIRGEWPEGELVFVQGIIDAFFYETEMLSGAKRDGGEDDLRDGIVLVDYKTDRAGDAEELVSKYRVQLDSYAEALTRVTGLEVREKIIWSVALGREIHLEDMGGLPQ